MADIIAGLYTLAGYMLLNNEFYIDTEVWPANRWYTASFGQVHDNAAFLKINYSIVVMFWTKGYCTRPVWYDLYAQSCQVYFSEKNWATFKTFILNSCYLHKK